MRPRDPAVVAIIQARMSSSRLPGKVLKDIGGKPMLHRVAVRARRAQTLGRVIVATTTDPADDPVAVWCQNQGVLCFRGSPFDVLDRYYRAACWAGAEVVVRLTADCPEIDRTVRAFEAAQVDFAANRLPPPFHRTTPIGMDTEVVSFAALARTWREAEAKYAREHVMPYLYEEAGRFRTLLVDHDPDWGQVRLTVDTADDLALIRRIYAHFDNTDEFSLDAVMALLAAQPDLLALNASVSHKRYTDVDDRA